MSFNLEDWVLMKALRTTSFNLWFLDKTTHQDRARFRHFRSPNSKRNFRVYRFVGETLFNYAFLTFNAHNDYDLSIANVMEAIKAGAHGLHLTVNGMGERAGNAPLSSAIV
jgi:hypothetical protein